MLILKCFFDVDYSQEIEKIFLKRPVCRFLSNTINMQVATETFKFQNYFLFLTVI